MGGFTTIRLKDNSQANIDLHNQKLREFKLAKKYYFYSIKNIKIEYEGFVKGEGVYPDHLFPKDKINSFKDFRKYWSTKAIGESFCPPFGVLRCDVYYSRMSERNKRALGRYFMANIDAIKEVNGSSTAFFERCFTKRERMKCREYGFDVGNEVADEVEGEITIKS
jgi:hypothetical protein